jgi:hypothetical protein
MDDQRADRASGAVVRWRPTISLGRLLVALSWVCVFLGALWLLRDWSRTPGIFMKVDWRTSIYGATIFALLAVSPFLAIATLFNRPRWGLALGFIVGIVVLLLV